jgi:hypothetical protein
MALFTVGMLKKALRGLESEDIILMAVDTEDGLGYIMPESMSTMNPRMFRGTAVLNIGEGDEKPSKRKSPKRRQFPQREKLLRRSAVVLRRPSLQKIKKSRIHSCLIEFLEPEVATSGFSFSGDRNERLLEQARWN